MNQVLLYASVILASVSFFLCLYACARVGKLLNSVKGLDWDIIASLTGDIGTIKNSEKVVVNEGVTEKLADTENGETWTKTGTENVYQSIDQSKLVPLLVKTIQELEARITVLESA